MRRENMAVLHSLADSLAKDARRLLEDDSYWNTYGTNAPAGIRATCAKILDIANEK